MPTGIHHVTAIAADARRNFNFYTSVLGLRFVKKTVNFDDPGTYHFYYGDEAGRPGTILTFFPWANVASGRRGTGQTFETALRVPEGSIGAWTHRFVARGVPHEAPEKRFGETVLRFQDPDGMSLALVGVAGAEREAGWAGADIPVEHAIRGFHGITLLLEDGARTGAILTDVLGLVEVASEDVTVRYTGDAALGQHVDIRTAKGFLPSGLGGGSVHHVAFRAADDAAQGRMVQGLADRHGIRTTEQLDRNYFRSVYFREPGGILFEIATDDPGFAADESIETLGRDLKLPRFLEPRRREIEAVLPALG
jgi:glyoxalase family protein